MRLVRICICPCYLIEGEEGHNRTKQIQPQPQCWRYVRDVSTWNHAPAVQSPVVLVSLLSACPLLHPRVSSSGDDNSCVPLTGVCRQADTLIQTSNGAPFLRTASVERAAADAAAKKQAAEAKIASLGVTAPERTASAEIKQLASRQAMVRRQTSLPCNPSHPQEFER